MIESGVIDWSHIRLIGTLDLANSIILLKISSPSLAASQAFTISAQFLGEINFLIAVSCFRLLPLPLFGFNSKDAGINGSKSTLFLQSLRRSSYSSGVFNSNKWPTAHVTTMSSESQCVSVFCPTPNTLAMSSATLGFSAMITTAMINAA